MRIINKQPGAFLQNLTKSYTEGVYADTPANRKLGRVGMSYAAYAEKLKKENKKEGDIENMSINKEIRDLFNETFFSLLEIANHETGTKVIQKLDTWEVEGKTIGEKIKNLPDNYFKQVFDIIVKGKYTSDPSSIYSNFKKKLKEIQARENDKKENKFIIENLINKTKTLKNAEGKRLNAIIKYSNSSEEVEGIKVDKDATDEEKKIAIAKFYFNAAEGNAENLDSIIEDALSEQ